MLESAAKMSVLVFGPGFLGHRLAASLPGAVLSTADIADAAAVAAELARVQPRSVINAAGKTGKPNVDWCESHPFETFRSNVTGALTLAQACHDAKVHLVHLASGCVFYGPSPAPGGWREDDFANPSAVYSRSKYAADLALSSLPDVAVARLRMPIDGAPGSRNLITKLAGYPHVLDVENSVTVVDDLVQVVGELVERRATGVFHVVNPGTMRHRDLLALYKELVDPGHQVELVTPEQLLQEGAIAKARSNCILSSTRLADLGIRMRPIDVALRDCMEQYARAATGA